MLGKIENERPDNGPASKDSRTDIGASERAASTDRTNQVDVSTGVMFGKTAIEGNAAPQLRPEAIARGRALLNSRRLGRDPYALADALINADLDWS